MSLLVDFGRALGQMADPRFRRVLWRALLVVIAALVAVTGGALFVLARLLPETMTLPVIGETALVGALATSAALGLGLVLSVVTIVPATAAAAGFFLDDVAAAVEARHYPGLPPATAPSVRRQALDSLRFFTLVVVANLGALAVYLIAPPLAPIAFWLVNGLLLGREYFQLVASRRMSGPQAERLRRSHGARVWLAGVAMALPLSVPLLNLVVPILGVAVFTHQFHRIARS